MISSVVLQRDAGTRKHMGGEFLQGYESLWHGAVKVKPGL